MSIPNTMRTGITFGCAQENMYPETFFIIYHVLQAILRRCGFKDCLNYLEHNSLIFDDQVLNTGIIFNLFSEYGVGKPLKPLIYELFSSLSLDFEINKNNIFFQEIIRLTPEVSNIIRKHDPQMESTWLNNYPINMINVTDPISVERELRLADLFLSDSEQNEHNENEIENEHNDNEHNENEIEISDETIHDSENEDLENSSDSADENEIIHGYDKTLTVCECLFCDEFRKYNFIGNVNQTINDVLTEIAQEINRTRI